MAIKARLAACVEAGMNLQTAGPSPYMTEAQSVAQFYMSEGKKQLLESCLVDMGWDQEAICNLFDQEASDSLALALQSLRPPFRLSQSGESLKEYYMQRDDPCIHNFDPAEHYMAAAAKYERERVSAMNKSYRNCFPEEEGEIRELLSKYDEYLPVKDLPAVNGLTEDFWD